MSTGCSGTPVVHELGAEPGMTVERASGRVVGSTRYGNIDPANRRVEIGWTWVRRPPPRGPNAARPQRTR